MECLLYAQRYHKPLECPYMIWKHCWLAYGPCYRQNRPVASHQIHIHAAYNESEDLLMELALVLLKRPSCSPFPCCPPIHKDSMGAHSKTAAKHPDISPEEPSQDGIHLPGTLILNFSGSRTVRNECLRFESPHVWYLKWQPELILPYSPSLQG